MSDDTYWARRILVDALMQAMEIPPTRCSKCTWPTGGSGRYVCLCDLYASPAKEKP